MRVYIYWRKGVGKEGGGGEGGGLILLRFRDHVEPFEGKDSGLPVLPDS